MWFSDIDDVPKSPSSKHFDKLKSTKKSPPMSPSKTPKLKKTPKHSSKKPSPANIHDVDEFLNFASMMNHIKGHGGGRHPSVPPEFKDCNIKGGSVSVPHYTYTLHSQPVVYQKISKNVEYNKVPVTYEFNHHAHPERVVKSPCCLKRPNSKPCSPCESPRPCRSPTRPGISPYPRDRLSCSREFRQHVNRSPCQFPRWQQKYVPQKFSPCSVATLPRSPCERKFCGSC